MPFFYWKRKDSLYFKVKVFPSASVNAIVGIRRDELVVKVKAPPEAGKANRELVAFLSKEFGISRQSIRIISGKSKRHKTLSVTDIVAAQQGSILNWTLFTNPFAVAAAMIGFLGSMMRPPFDVVIAPQEIPIGPPTEYHSSYLALMQTNRAIFPIAKIVVYMNLFFGGAASWPVFFLKVFLIYMVSVLVGVAFPRFRVEQSIRWFLIWGVPLGIIAVVMV